MLDRDRDSDIYGRHAATPDRPVGLPTQFFGREMVIPWSAFVYPGAAPVTSHVATWDHPAGVFFERAGLIHFRAHPRWDLRQGRRLGPVKRGEWADSGYDPQFLRYGERPLKKLTSRD